MSKQSKKIAILIRKGKIDEAVKHLKAEQKKSDNSDELKILEAMVWIKREEHYRARNILCQRSLDLNPSASYELARLSIKERDYIEATRLLLKVLALEPGHYKAQIELAGLHLMSGNASLAIPILSKITKARPDLYKAWQLLGDYEKSLGHYEQAAGHYLAAQKRCRNDASLLEKIGGCLYLQGETRASSDYFKKALKIDSTLHAARLNLGLTQTRLGELNSAEKTYIEGIKASPANAELTAGLACVYERRKKYNEAYELLKPFIVNAEIAHPDIGLAYARTCKPLNKCDDAINYIEKAIRAGISKNKQQQLYYSLGKLLDIQGEYEKAFISIKNANSLTKVVYEHYKHERMMKMLRSFFTEALFKNSGYHGNLATSPIFIVGMPRSGTSLIEQILCRHSRVYGAGELNTITELVSRLQEKYLDKAPYPDCLVVCATRELDDITRTYLRKTHQVSNNAPYVVDKMPHNFMHVGLLAWLLPNAKIIHCKRNPVDTCLSIYFQDFSASHPYSTSLTDLARYYNEYEKLMNHWHETLGERIHTVFYESTVANFKESVMKILDYCGLDWEETCETFYEDERFVKTASYDQVSEPIYTSSINRCENYAPYISDLIDNINIEYRSNTFTKDRI